MRLYLIACKMAATCEINYAVKKYAFLDFASSGGGKFLNISY